MGWRSIFNHVFIHTIPLATGIVVVLVFIVLWGLNVYTHHNEAVLVPDVKGLKMEDATPFFINKSLRYVVVDSVYNQSVPPGHIVETTPKAGTKVKVNRIIFITTNAVGLKKISVPDVIDQSQRQALFRLKAEGFTNVSVEYIPAAFKDLVIGLKLDGKQLPEGEKVPSNAHLVLEVSSGSVDPGEFQTDEQNYLDIE